MPVRIYRRPHTGCGRSKHWREVPFPVNQTGLWLSPGRCRSVLKTREQHLKHLELVLERITGEKICLQKENPKLRYSAKGLLVSTEPADRRYAYEKQDLNWRYSGKIRQADATNKRPGESQTKRQVRGFLGPVGYYCKLTPNFAKLACLLSQLLREGSDLVRRSRHTRAVQQLEEALVETHRTPALRFRQTASDREGRFGVRYWCSVGAGGRAPAVWGREDESESADVARLRKRVAGCRTQLTR